MIYFDGYIRGNPKAQPRPRFSRSGHVYTPPTASEWKQKISDAIRLAKMKITSADTPLHVTMRFFLEHKTKTMWHVSRPDIDNLVKAVLDAITDAGAWPSDAQVSSICASKEYSHRPGMYLLVKEEKPVCA